MTLTGEMYTNLLRASEVPEPLHDGLVRYLTAGVRPGAFLTAVLSNQLKQAVAHGDEHSLAGLVPLVQWLYNAAPAVSWGSESTMHEWMAQMRQKVSA